MDPIISLTLPASNERLDVILTRHFTDVSRAQIQAWVKDGLVTLDGKIVKQASLKISKEMTALVTPPVKTPFTPPAPEDRPDTLNIVYEDEHLLVINKPTGLVVHPGAGNHSGTLVNALLAHTNGQLSSVNTMERPGIVHRLDKDTSGLMLVAKTNLVHVKLAEALKKRDIKRHYVTLVWGVPTPASGTITSMLGRDPRNRQRRTIVTHNGKEAVTHYKTLGFYPPEAALVECRLETGRTHQIRVHMLQINCAVIGDPLYKKMKMPSPKHFSQELVAALGRLPGQALHAKTLSFDHPITGEALTFTVEPPEIFTEIMALLKDGHHFSKK